MLNFQVPKAPGKGAPAKAKSPLAAKFGKVAKKKGLSMSDKHEAGESKAKEAKEMANVKKGLPEEKNEPKGEKY